MSSHNPHPRSKRQPVIVLGMHRSGTSMLVGLLRDLGLHIGANTPRNNESKLFRRLNIWLVGQGGGHWDNPAGVEKLLSLPALRHATDQLLVDVLSSIRARDFLGWKGWLQYRSLFELDRPWGWKDPVNTYTLPFWLDLFPDAKVIHIYRNGVDISYSMHKRTHQVFRERYAKWNRRRVYYHFKPWRRRFTSIHTWKLEDCFQLWQDYLAKSKAQVDALPADRTFTLQYEQFLADPAPTLARLADFCGLDADAEDIRARTSEIDASRAFAFLRDEEKLEFARKQADSLAEWGYDIDKLARENA